MVSNGSPKRNWLQHPAARPGVALLIASVVAGLLWVWLQPPTVLIPERQGPQPRSADYQAASGPCDPKRLAAITRKAARADKERACAKEEKDDAREDAAATQAYRVTNATEEALRLARSQAIVAFAQAILTALAVVFTGWAAWAAADAARAAKASVEDAREDATTQTDRFERQFSIAKQSADAAIAAAQATLASVQAYQNAERAWIGPMGMTVGFSSGSLDGNPVREGFIFTINLMNTGNTPAVRVQSRITHAIRNFGDEEVPTFDVAHDFNGSMSASAMKGLAFSPPIRMLNDTDTQLFIARRAKVYAYCLVQYESSLSPDQPRVTEICLVGKYNGEVTDPASGMRHPNIDWTPVGDQNRAT